MNFQQILIKQELYKKKHGKYFQVLKGAKKPNDEKNPNDVDMKGFPLDIEVHDSVGPDGIGFTVIEKKTELGKEFIKQTGHGTGYTNDWQEVIRIN